MFDYRQYDLLIGIDTGKHTGVACCFMSEGKRIELETLPIHKAMRMVELLSKQYKNVLVRFEDARKRKWFGNNSYAKQQGAGSVKRDAVIWEDFLTDLKKESAKLLHILDFEAVAPKDNITKMSPQYLKLLTGYDKKSSEHARDAVGLIIKTCL